MSRQPIARCRGGFTLVELLVTITIIGILATIVMAALQAAQESARADATRATIAKINDIIMAKYDSYRDRRLGIASIRSDLTQAELVGARLDAMRDLMRLEMPERWNEIGDPTASPDPGPPLTFDWSLSQPWMGKDPANRARYPAVTQRYQLLRREARAGLTARGYNATQVSEIVGRYASAKLLYMIVVAAEPDAASYFRNDEIGRPTEDGLPVFLDGWGNPIKFLRWAPGFTDSDLQPAVEPFDSTAVRQAVAAANPDPLNPRKLVNPASTLRAPITRELGWRLVPLIYSAGPDGIYDIATDHVSSTTGTSDVFYNGNPYSIFTTASGDKYGMGAAQDSDNTSVTATGSANGRLDHYDNIHNHRVE